MFVWLVAGESRGLTCSIPDRDRGLQKQHLQRSEALQERSVVPEAAVAVSRSDGGFFRGPPAAGDIPDPAAGNSTSAYWSFVEMFDLF